MKAVSIGPLKFIRNTRMQRAETPRVSPAIAIQSAPRKLRQPVTTAPTIEPIQDVGQALRIWASDPDQERKPPCLPIIAVLEGDWKPWHFSTRRHVLACGTVRLRMSTRRDAGCCRSMTRRTF